MDRIFDRLGKVLLSWLRSSSDNTRSPTDPHMKEAWEELNAYLKGEEDYGSHESSRDRHDDTQTGNEHRGQDKNESLREDYANLEVPFGAPFEQVKRSYKKMIRRYHPDRHSSDPEKLKLATEITTKINESYHRIKTFNSHHS